MSSNAQKCACNDCVCMVDGDRAVEQNNNLYCSKSCAKGHPDGSGCGHAGCDCSG